MVIQTRVACGTVPAFVCLGLAVGLEGVREAGRDTRGPGISSCDPFMTPAFPQDRTQGRIPNLAPGCSVWKAGLPQVRKNLNIPWPPQGCFYLPFWHPKMCKDSPELQELIESKCPSSWGNDLLSPLFNAVLRSRIFTTGCFFIVTVK